MFNVFFLNYAYNIKTDIRKWSKMYMVNNVDIANARGKKKVSYDVYNDMTQENQKLNKNS